MYQTIPVIRIICCGPLGTLGRMQLAHISRNGVNKHKMCGHVHVPRGPGPDQRDHYSTRQLISQKEPESVIMVGT